MERAYPLAGDKLFMSYVVKEECIEKYTSGVRIMLLFWDAYFTGYFFASE